MKGILLCSFFLLVLVGCQDREEITLPEGEFSTSNLFDEVGKVPQSTQGYPTDGSSPNFIFVIVDDLRYDALGIIQSRLGARGRFPMIQTPHIDAMAQNGALFTHAFVTTSLCSPSRASILTGQVTHRHGIKGKSQTI